MAKRTSDSSLGVVPPGRRARKALAVRHALFEAGLSASQRQPLHLVSVLDITERADVAKGVFYLQFDNKEEYLLALWEEVQRRLLERLAAAETGPGRKQPGHVARLTREILAFAREFPATARFWLRIASYFPDELGEPGHLTRLRQTYLRKLACITVGKSRRELRANDIRAALTLDTLCWAAIDAGMHMGRLRIEEDTLIRAVKAALSRQA